MTPAANAPALQPPIAELIYLNTGPSRVGWSMYGTANQCLQRFAYTYRLGFDPGFDPDATLRGSLGHVGQAHHWARVRARQMRRDPNRYMQPLDAMARYAQETPGGRAHIEEMQQCFLAYTSQHPEAPGDVLLVEEELVLVAGWCRREWGLWLIHPDYVDQVDVHIGDYPLLPRVDGEHIEPARLPFERWVTRNGEQARRTPHVFVSRRVDMAYRKAGAFIVDWKHTGHDTGKGRANKYAADGQWALNRIAGRQRWPDFRDCIVVLIKTEAPFPSKWHRVAGTPWRDATMPQRIWDTAHRIAQLDAEPRDPWQWPRADHETVCHGRYGSCPMNDLCDFGPRGGGQ